MPTTPTGAPVSAENQARSIEGYDTTYWSDTNYYNYDHYGGPGTVSHAPYSSNEIENYINGYTNTVSPEAQAMLTQSPTVSRDDVIRNLQALTGGRYVNGMLVDSSSFSNNTNSISGVKNTLDTITGALSTVMQGNQSQVIGAACLAAPFLLRRNRLVRQLKLPLLFLGSYLSGLGTYTSSKITPMLPAGVQSFTINPLVGAGIDALLINTITGRKARRFYGRSRYYARRSFSRRRYSPRINSYGRMPRFYRNGMMAYRQY